MRNETAYRKNKPAMNHSSLYNLVKFFSCTVYHGTKHEHENKKIKQNI